MVVLRYGAEKYDRYITITKGVAKESILSKSNAKSHYVWRRKKHGKKRQKHKSTKAEGIPMIRKVR